MVKITKSKLKEVAKDLGAIEIKGNVYDYENMLYYITRGKCENKDYNYNVQVEDIQNLCNDNENKGSKQLYYSAGTYGNNGQLHMITKKNGKILYIYYC
jgi:hypothetical protein